MNSNLLGLDEEQRQIEHVFGEDLKILYDRTSIEAAQFGSHVHFAAHGVFNSKEPLLFIVKFFRAAIDPHLIKQLLANSGLDDVTKEALLYNFSQLSSLRYILVNKYNEI